MAFCNFADMAQLNDKQETFCREYLIDLNATQAAIRAGYSKNTAYSQGQRLLKNVEVQKRLIELMSKRTERTKIDSDYVLRRLVEIDELDIADILDSSGDIKSVKMWPDAWRKSIGGFEVTKTQSADEINAWLKKVKLPDKLKTVELIGKHVGVQAFRDNISHSGEIGITWNEQKIYEAKSKTDTGS